jgi:hypothetical protein
VVIVVLVSASLALTARLIYRRPARGFSDSLEQSETMSATHHRRLFNRNEWRGVFALSDRQRRQGR